MILSEHLFSGWLNAFVKLMQPSCGKILERTLKHDWLTFSFNECCLIDVQLRETMLDPSCGEILKQALERDWLTFFVNKRRLTGVLLRKTTWDCD